VLKRDWPDLLIQDCSQEEMRSWLEPWQWCLNGRVTPLFLSRFGCWFLQRPEGMVEMLDVFFGQVEEVAPSYETFLQSVDTPSWQEVYLLSDFVFRLHVAGKVAAGIDCYAIAPHPAVGGPDPWSAAPLDTESVMIMDAPIWQGVCAQLLLTAREAGSS